MKRLNDKGEEVLDPTPLSVPVRLKKEKSLQQMVEEVTRRAMLTRDLKNVEESIDDPLDFDENPLPDSPHEEVFDEDLGRAVTKAEKKYLDEHRKEFDNYILNKRKEALNARYNRKSDELRQEVDSDSEVDKGPLSDGKSVSRQKSSSKD